MSGLGLGDMGEVERATVLFVQRATWRLMSRITLVCVCVCLSHLQTDYTFVFVKMSNSVYIELV